MKKIGILLNALTWLVLGAAASAQDIVHFPSLYDNGPEQPGTMLDGYLFQPAGDGRHPAIVGMHGCSGMFTRKGNSLTSLYRAWASEFTRQGYVVLLVDSLGPRHHGETCSIAGFDLDLYRRRPRDAYGALLFLQAQPYIQGDRIALVGWSQGGGVTLYAIGKQSLARPAALPQGDFRAAVAFYPGSCSERRQAADWTTSIPLLVLLGAADVWTPAEPCKAFVEGAIARGAPIEMQLYPGAYHAFDAPDRPRTELPEYRTRDGVVPIVGTDPAARQDALSRVPAFLARYLRQ